MTYPHPVTTAVGSRHTSDDTTSLSTRAWLVVLVLVAIAVFAGYAAVGTNFVLDDWFTLAHARFEGAFSAAGADQRVARPGAWLVYALVFGAIGRNPLPILVLQSAMGGATAVLLFLTLRRLVREELAGVAALLWLVLPNHTSLEVWASAANIALAILLLVGGCFLLSSPRLGRAQVLGAAVVLAASVLCYEATLPVAALAAIAVPWLVGRRLRWDAVVACGVSLGSAALWIVAHWHPAKEVSKQLADLTQMIGAHLGWGVAPDGIVADVLMLCGLVGIAFAVARVALPSMRPRAGADEWLVVAGLVVVVLGTLPFAFYLYAPLGAGDRFNAVSSVGGAMAWAGIIGMVARARRPVALGALAVLLLAGVVARAERVLLWHRAGSDAVAILDGVRETIPDPDGTIVLGPTPIQQGNVAAFLDQSNVDAAVKVVYDDPDVQGGLAFSQTQFDEAPEHLRFDIRPVSELQPDTVVTGG